MPDDAPLRWLIFEGLVPVFGAGALYLLYGFCRQAAATRPQIFAWKEAFDSIVRFSNAPLRNNLRCFGIAFCVLS